MRSRGAGGRARLVAVLGGGRSGVRGRAAQSAGWVAACPAQPGSDVGRTRMPQQADRQVAQRCHHAGRVAGADLGAVLVEGHVADPVQPVLDLPLAADQCQQPGGVGLVGGEAGHGVGDLDRAAAAIQVAHGAVDDEQLGGVRKGDRVGWGAHPDRSVLDAPMPTGSLGVRRGETPRDRAGR
jgi:hypothetical protein